MNRNDSTARRPLAIVGDKDAATRKVCRSILEDDGFQVVETTDQQDLLSLAASHQPQVIIVDAFLSGVSCADPIGSLRSIPDTATIPIIATGDLDRASESLGRLDHPATAYLAKPIRPQELAARVQDLIRQREGKTAQRPGWQLLGEHARIHSLLLDFSAGIAGSDDLRGLAETTVQVATGLTTCGRGAVLLPDPDRGVLRVAAAIGLEGRLAEELEMPIGEGVSGRICASGGRFVVEHPGHADPGGEVYDSRLFVDGPALAMAMRTAERSVGVLYLSQRMGGAPFSEQELAYLDIVCNCAGAAIHSVSARKSREDARDAITVALASLAEYRDNETGEHLDRMNGFCQILATRLKQDGQHAGTIDSDFIEDLRRAAPLHDIGKVAIPDCILLKPGRLTPQEIEVMRTHAAIGAKTIRSALSRWSDSRFLRLAEEIAQSHHEWFDGTGYPCGLGGASIPLAARIAALADVYDALTSRRVYKEAMPHSRARSIIVGLSGRQFDPSIVDAFLACESEFQKRACASGAESGQTGETDEAASAPGPLRTAPRDREEAVVLTVRSR